MRFLVLLLLVALAQPALAQQPQRVIFVPSDPSGACSVVAALRYNTLNGSLWGCNNGTWATTNGSGSMTWPAAAGIAVYAGGSAWGTSLTAPTGALVGTTDTQSLTNKTVDGVTPTTFSFLDPTSSVQTQLGNRVVSGAPNAQAATYQVLAADFSSFKTITVASGTFTVTLVASGSQPASGQYIRVVNYGSGVVTIARSGQNINGGVTSLTLGAASATSPTSVFVISDGTNYFGSTAGGTVITANPFVIAFQTAGYSAQANGSVVTFDTNAAGSTSSMHNTSTNTSRFIAPNTGLYEARCVLDWSSGTSGQWGSYLQVNGTTRKVLTYYANIVGFDTYPVAGIFTLTAGDYVECITVQAGSATLTAGADATQFSLRQIQ